MRGWLLLLGLAACKGPVDADFDGFTAEEDCDDQDPYVYPGAPDSPEDGVDGDCVGGDATLDYPGAWTITDLRASYSGVEIFVPGTATGALELAADRSAAVQFSATLSEVVAGYEIGIELAMAGDWSALADPSDLTLYAEGGIALGDTYSETVHVAWDCTQQGEAMACDGELKAVGGSLDAEVALERAD